jgi:hypothetical protein
MQEDIREAPSDRAVITALDDLADMQEEGAEPEVPLYVTMEKLRDLLMAAVELCEPISHGNALYYEGWHAIAGLFDDLTTGLQEAGMEVNRDTNPIYINLRKALEDIL